MVTPEHAFAVKPDLGELASGDAKPKLSEPPAPPDGGSAFPLCVRTWLTRNVYNPAFLDVQSCNNQRAAR